MIKIFINDKLITTVSEDGILQVKTEEGLKVAPIPSNNFRIGDRFAIIDEGEGEAYILAQAKAGEVALISLREGNRWENSIHVTDADNITAEEWTKITSNCTFRKIHAAR